MKCPCIRCQDRAAGSKDGPSCHACCEKYKNYRIEFKAKKAKEKAARDIVVMLDNSAKKRAAYLAADKRRRKQR